MKKSYVRLLLMAIWTITGIGSVFSQSSAYWYVDGLPNVWFYQPDMFAFKCYNGAGFTGTTDSTIVDSIAYHAEREDKAIEVYFKPTATPTEIITQGNI